MTNEVQKIQKIQENNQTTKNKPLNKSPSPSSSPEISVIIPVYNEEANIVQLFNELKETLQSMKKSFEILFIDDGSKDQTLAKLKELLSEGDAENYLRIIEFRKNFGQTPALLAGFNQAKGKYIVTMDGDLQNDPADIPRMFKALTDEVDVVCGWRKNRKDNWLKKIPSRINNWLNRRLTGVEIHDSGCTLRLYRREATQNLPLFAEGHRYIPAMLAKQGFRLTEIETNHRPRVKGKTKYGAKRLFRGFTDLITLFLIHRWGSKPIHLFSQIGLFFLFFGFLSGLWLLCEKYLFWLFWSKYQWNHPISQRPLLFLCILLILTGVQFFFFGYLAELIARGTQDPKESYSIRREYP